MNSKSVGAAGTWTGGGWDGTTGDDSPQAVNAGSSARQNRSAS